MKVKKYKEVSVMFGKYGICAIVRDASEVERRIQELAIKTLVIQIKEREALVEKLESGISVDDINKEYDSQGYFKLFDVRIVDKEDVI